MLVIRLIRMPSEKLNKSLGDVSTQFLQLGVLKYIEDNFDLFHVQGDEAIYFDIMSRFQKSTICHAELVSASLKVLQDKPLK